MTDAKPFDKFMNLAIFVLVAIIIVVVYMTVRISTKYETYNTIEIGDVEYDKDKLDGVAFEIGGDKYTFRDLHEDWGILVYGEDEQDYRLEKAFEAELYLWKARKLGMELSREKLDKELEPGICRARFDARESVLGDMTRDVREELVDSTPEAVKEWYEKHKNDEEYAGDFVTPESYDMWAVLSKSKDAIDEAKASLETGDFELDAFLEKYEDSDGVRQEWECGTLRQIFRYFPEEDLEKLFGLKAGDIIGPLEINLNQSEETPDGEPGEETPEPEIAYFVFKVESYTPSGVKDYEQVSTEAKYKYLEVMEEALFESIKTEASAAAPAMDE